MWKVLRKLWIAITLLSSLLATLSSSSHRKAQKLGNRRSIHTCFISTKTSRFSSMLFFLIRFKATNSAWKRIWKYIQKFEPFDSQKWLTFNLHIISSKRWWEYLNWSGRGCYLDLTPNSPNKFTGKRAATYFFFHLWKGVTHLSRNTCITSSITWRYTSFPSLRFNITQSHDNPWYSGHKDLWLILLWASCETLSNPVYLVSANICEAKAIFTSHVTNDRASGSRACSYLGMVKQRGTVN